MEKLKILIAIDEPDLAKNIVYTTTNIVNKETSEITLLNVIENYNVKDEYFYRQPEKFIEHEAAKADYAYIESCLENEGFDYKGFIYKEGNAAKNILNVIKEEKYDLVVVGSHNRHGFQELLLGSVSKNVAEHCKCSILIVKAGQPICISKGEKIKAIFATDGSEYSLFAAENVSRYIDKSRSAITVLNVTYPISEIIPADSYIYVDIVRLMEDTRNAAKRIIEETTDILAPSGINIVNNYHIDGDAASSIIEESEKNFSNLIIMGSHGKTGITKWLMGSVSSKVFEYAPIPVLIIKKPIIK